MQSVIVQADCDDDNIRVPGWNPSRSVGNLHHLPAYYEAPPPRRRAPERSVDALIGGRPEGVFQPDNRIRVTTPSIYPFSAICGLTIVNQRMERFAGTGFLAGPRLVITAGHNLFFHGEGWMRRVEVFPGLDQNRVALAVRSSSYLATVDGWISDANREFDFGAVFLKEDLNEVAGFLSFSKLTANSLNTITVSLTGYPLDPPRESGFPSGGTTCWTASGSVRAEMNQLTYDIDSSIGQSGSPLIARFPGQADEFQVVAIHNTAYPNFNAATRINDAVFAQILRWRIQSEA